MKSAFKSIEAINKLPHWGLGGFSMLLLAAFLGFWLQKEYQEQKTILQKETDNLFKATIQALEDSVIQSKIAWAQKNQSPMSVSLKATTSQIPKSSIKAQAKPALIGQIALRPEDISSIVVRPRAGMKVQITDSVNIGYLSADSFMRVTPHTVDLVGGKPPKEIKMVAIYNNNAPMTDSLRQSITMTLRPHQNLSDSMTKLVLGRVVKVLQKATIQADSQPKRDPKKWVFSVKSTQSFTRDCVLTGIHPPSGFSISQVGPETKENQVVFRFFEDSLRVKDIRRAYQKQITRAKIDLAFEVRRAKTNPTLKHTDLFHTTYVKSTMPIGANYAAVFPNYQGYLLKKIIPQSLFSLFLLGITGIAFATIYRNLQRQRRLTQLKNDFISNVTHELKTPIATVSVAIEALQNFGVANNPAQTQEYLEISKNELNRLTLLVDKVLKMATFEEQGLALNKEIINLHELVQQVLKSMKLQFEKYGAYLTPAPLPSERGNAAPLSLGRGVGGEVLADRIHLTNVVYNLLDNALKYSHQNPQIGVQVSETEAEISLSVSDNGIGIPAEYQSKIFEKFFRVPTGDTHNVKGHGLGLSYVASVIEQHGGRLKLQSEEGQGSTFTVVLPK
jgi:two-component system, OmpR family, phosphate regulon sensor histidine kinase PhoR